MQRRRFGRCAPQMAGRLEARREIGGWLKKLNPFASKEDEPQAPKKPSKLEKARAMADIAKLAADMRKAQADGSNPMAALGKDKTLSMQDLLEFQKKISSGPEGANFMKQQMELMAKLQQAGGPGAAAALGGAGAPKPQMPGAASAAKPALGSSSKPAAHQRRPLPKAGGGKPTEPLRAAPAAAASQSPAAPPPGQPDLGPEVEALFAELREMRKKKNEYKSLLDHAQRDLKLATADAERLTGVETDLRKRLARAEKDVSLLNTEAVELREKLKEGRGSAKALRELQAEINHLRESSTRTAASDERHVKQARVLEGEVKRVRRRLDRLRASDPVIGFGMCAHDLVAFGRDYSAVDDSASHADAPEVDEAVVRMHQHVSREILASWPVSVGEPAREVVLSATRAFWGAVVPHARFDAKVTAVGDVSHLRALIKDGGLRILSEECDGDNLTLTVGAASLAASDPCGPTGVLRAYAELSQFQQSGAGGASDTLPMSRVRQVVPIVTAEMLKDEGRCTVAIRTSRSSGPGGQAANVGETHVSASLSIDGVNVARSQSQDSRSNQTNTETARARLIDESLPRFNHSIARRSANVIKAAGAAPESRPLTAQQWDAQWSCFADGGSATDRVLVAGLRRLAVGAESS